MLIANILWTSSYPWGLVELLALELGRYYDSFLGHIGLLCSLFCVLWWSVLMGSVSVYFLVFISDSFVMWCDCFMWCLMGFFWGLKPLCFVWSYLSHLWLYNRCIWRLSRWGFLNFVFLGVWLIFIGFIFGTFWLILVFICAILSSQNAYTRGY